MKPSSRRTAIVAAAVSAVAGVAEISAQTVAAMREPKRVRVGNFLIDETEVTVGQFRAFATATSLRTAAERDGGGFEYVGGWTRRPGWSWSAPFGTSAGDNEPAVHVSWSEAKDFCVFTGGRLPTFEEWKLAAYTETRDDPTDGFVKARTYRYPVGDSPNGMNNNRERHVDVATTKRGVNGIFDMGANAWEWTADRRGDEALTAGGSWWYGPETTAVSGAQWKPASFYAVYVGFRCVHDLKR